MSKCLFKIAEFSGFLKNWQFVSMIYEHYIDLAYHLQNDR